MINIHESYVAKLGFKLMVPGSVVRHSMDYAMELGRNFNGMKETEQKSLHRTEIYRHGYMTDSQTLTSSMERYLTTIV